VKRGQNMDVKGLKVRMVCGLAVSTAMGLAGALVATRAAAADEIKIDSDTFGNLSARAIGPAVMGGRIAAIDAYAGDKLTIYVGAASGGVWKTENGGLTFKHVFDDYVQSIGAVRIDPSAEDDLGRHGRILGAEQRFGRRGRVQDH